MGSWQRLAGVLATIAAVVAPAASANAASGATVSGTITDATTGAPIENICVDVLTPGGDLVARGFTAADGSYTSRGRAVAAGGYVVRVNGCPNDKNLGFTREYWPDALSAESATVLELGPEEQRQGIDETLVGSADGTYHVDGSRGVDTRRPACPGGTEAYPWRTIEHGMRCLQPGGELIVHGGTYTERVLPVVTPGRKDAPVVVRAAAGERVVVRGLIRLAGADYWTLDGIDVTNDGRPYGSGEYLVKFRDGVGWTLTNAEIWGANSYAALRIETSGGNEPADWRVADSCVHDTNKTNGYVQDHNVYVATGLATTGGVIERNTFFNAVNGTNVKLGYTPEADKGTANVVIRNNTMWNAVQNVLAAGGSANNRVERNLVGQVIRPADKPWYPNIRGIALVGRGNIAKDNLSSGTKILHNDMASDPGWLDRGGNRGGVNPRFDHTRGCDGFRPRSKQAQGYGRYAGVSAPAPQPEPVWPQPDLVALDEVCDVSATGVTFRDVAAQSVHRRAIECVAANELTRGRAPGVFAPAEPVNRAQMATFLARLLEDAGLTLPAAPADAFGDDDGSRHEGNIDRLAAAGIVAGVREGRFEPSRTVTRQQMATFLIRAFEYSGDTITTSTDWFGDDDRSRHQDNINKAAELGVAGGIDPGRFAPSVQVRRDQMATFLARTAGLLRGR